MAILNRFSAIPLFCDSTLFLLLAADFLAIPGSRFWESCDSRFCATKLAMFHNPRTAFSAFVFKTLPQFCIRLLLVEPGKVIYLPSSTETLPTEKDVGGVFSCNDYSMITD